jgi:hypothetical protein
MKPEVLSHRTDREALRAHDVCRRNRKSSVLGRESQGQFDYAPCRTRALTPQEPYSIVCEIGCESVSKVIDYLGVNRPYDVRFLRLGWRIDRYDQKAV